MVKYHSDSERKHAATTRTPISDQQQGIFYMHQPTDRRVHNTIFVTLVVEHWLEREIVQWVHHEGSIQQPMSAQPWCNIENSSNEYVLQ